MKLAGTDVPRGAQVPWQELGVKAPAIAACYRIGRVSHFSGGDRSPEAKLFYAPKPRAAKLEKPPKKARKKN
jgi:hypothetical protein